VVSEKKKTSPKTMVLLGAALQETDPKQYFTDPFPDYEVCSRPE
jgi:hypothetical protein